MADLITTALLNLRPQEGSFVTDTVKGSAFQQVARQGTITHAGKVSRRVRKPVGNFSVAEGGSKLVLTGEFGETVILPSKKAYIVVATQETDETLKEVAQAFINYAPGAFAEEFDQNVAGVKADSNGRIKSLASTTDTTTVTLASGADVKAAYGALAATGALPTAWVLSSALYGHLIGLDANETDRKLSNELATTNTLMGRPVAVFNSTESIGFLRDFSTDEWALVGGDVQNRKATDGIITDSDGVTHNLTQENKVAYILEGFYSWDADGRKSTILLSGPEETTDPEEGGEEEEGGEG